MGVGGESRLSRQVEQQEMGILSCRQPEQIDILDSRPIVRFYRPSVRIQFVLDQLHPAAARGSKTMPDCVAPSLNANQ